MGGLVIDIYVVYLIKLIIWAFRMRGSGKWPAATGAVFFSDEAGADSSYPTARVTYTYEVNGESFHCENNKPFISSRSAKRYLIRFPEGSTIKVRIKPGHPKISVLRDDDQVIRA